ncbi:hypothetical protein [Cryobacterium zhongshanensis]|uniref:Uncharacterized protein n=1 Tax=Cryobacterium zhongshanensis TaxID=2928153 RepID=A0AA41UER3_9MICO|nr:hypothetical protein [Cryobacterium zhongshanensis]MCI4657322.1 hypothetical protein [Cryobacterium zhongshanensis]
MLFNPEYPSLKLEDPEEKAENRLAKSQRKFLGSPVKAAPAQPWLLNAVGDIGNFKNASTSAIDQWLQAWRMPPRSWERPDILSSRAVFVGLADTADMASVSTLQGGAPFVTVSSRFIKLCTQISEIFPLFGILVASDPTLDEIQAMRSLFQYLEPNSTLDVPMAQLLQSASDPLFIERTTAAAVRWSIAHEMAHAVAGQKDRQNAYKRVSDLMPNMEASQWGPKRYKLEKYEVSLRRYRDEIACDLLANDFILDSPFAADDLITQVSGALLALEALKWEGWHDDRSALSPTHPSPTLRFKIVLNDWLTKLADPDVWKVRERPGALGIEDLAHWVGFEKWGSGAYRSHRDGATWQDDIDAVRQHLTQSIPEIMNDTIYAKTDEGIFRVQHTAR